jgi:meso-butanediol dehydrogenase/(S,S)-butanediol dehydrogenase/diacetyl reductase
VASRGRTCDKAVERGGTIGMSTRFAGKVVLITGAGSGIGAATARRFAAEGARLMLGDVNAASGAAVREEIGGAAAFRRVDVRRMEEVEALTQAAIDEFGRLDVVVNNAGIGTYGRTPDLDPDLWRAILEVDLFSIFYGCRAAIPRLRANGGGAIVNTASISGLAGDYGLGAYNAAKGGVVNYTRTLAIDHARDGIRVNAVCPGPIDTPLAGPLLADPALVAEYNRLIPMGRVGRPEEIAAAIAFLASGDAAYVTGAMLVVDGGLLAATGQPNFSRFLGDA